MQVRMPRLPALDVAATAGTVGAVGLDAAWLGVRLAGYPWGALRARGAPGPSARAGIPVVLVHGLVDNRSAFAVLRGSLRRRGFGPVTAVNYPVRTRDVRDAAEVVARHVEQVCARTGAARVHVVGHSLGGIVARWYVQELGGDKRVDTVVTLGSPHAGTTAARLLPVPLLRQMRPGSDILTALAGPARGCRTRVVSVWSEDDEMIVPRPSARLEHADLDVTDVRLRGVGHFAIAAHPRAIAAVAAALRSVSEPEPAAGQSFSSGA